MFLFPPTEFELPTNLEKEMREDNPNFERCTRNVAELRGF